MKYNHNEFEAGGRMKKKRFLACCGTVLGLLMLSSPGFAATDHTDKITKYEGSKTCRTCHPDEVDDVSHVLHYRMLGPTQGVYDFLTNKPYPADVEKGKGNRY
jgi:hypothetical protein